MAHKVHFWLLISNFSFFCCFLLLFFVNQSKYLRFIFILNCSAPFCSCPFLLCPCSCPAHVLLLQRTALLGSVLPCVNAGKNCGRNVALRRKECQKLSSECRKNVVRMWNAVEKWLVKGILRKALRQMAVCHHHLLRMIFLLDFRMPCFSACDG